MCVFKLLIVPVYYIPDLSYCFFLFSSFLISLPLCCCVSIFWICHFRMKRCIWKYCLIYHFDCVFHTDVSDVVVVKNPEQLLKNFPEHSYFFCKDSIKLCQFPYLQWHKAFSFQDLIKFSLNQNRWDLINVGVGGGSFESMKKFYNEYCKIREPLGNFDINFDMWIPQYLLRSHFDDKFILGEPVCSEFKSYQEDRNDVYFIHK